MKNCSLVPKLYKNYNLVPGGKNCHLNMQLNIKIDFKQQLKHNKHVIKRLYTTFEKLRFSPRTLQKLHFCPRSGNYLILTQMMLQNSILILKIYSTHQNRLFDKSLQNYILAPEFCVITKLPQKMFLFVN